MHYTATCPYCGVSPVADFTGLTPMDVIYRDRPSASVPARPERIETGGCSHIRQVGRGWNMLCVARFNAGVPGDEAALGPDYAAVVATPTPAPKGTSLALPAPA